MDGVDVTELREHYASMEREDGYASRCRMWLPDDLAGKRVIDVGCRRGKGVYEISERVGAAGFVLGVDWSAAFLEAAQAGERHALDKSGLAASNMAFALGYPEEVDRVAGAGSFDVAIANSVLNLAYDRTAAYAALARTLRPGGLFQYAAVVAEEEPGERALAEACAVGDVRAAAQTEERLLAELRDAGFERCEVVERDEPFEDMPGVCQIVVAARVPTGAR
ncbi:MAG TPA: class I SAM-dependent methyltransferase [Candidatus Aveggerthella excrementigallinarum]|nr:class I SAM-dependent methyltransferase [Candidatus Aveggerthella excrementigallinarum]